MASTVPVQLFIYSAATGALLPGQLVAAGFGFEYLRRREVDGTSTDLLGSAPDVEEVDTPGAGSYVFELPLELLLPGTSIDWVLNTGAGSAGSQRVEGSIGAAAVGTDGAPGGVTVGDTDEIFLAVADQAPPFSFVIRNQAGEPVPLDSGSPEVTFSMWPAAGGEPVVDDLDVAIIDAAAGRVVVTWPLAAAATAGDFAAKFRLTQNGVVSHHPVNRSIVVRVVAVAP